MQYGIFRQISGKCGDVSSLALALDSCETNANVSEQLHVFLRPLGIASLSCFKIPERGETLNECTYLSSHSQAWTDRYTEKKYLINDPLILYAKRSSKAARWSDIVGHDRLSPAEVLIHRERLTFGDCHGVVTPMVGPRGYKAVLNCGGRIPIDLDDISLIGAASIIAHHRLLALAQRLEQNEASLTCREIECLKWRLRANPIGRSDRLSTSAIRP